jgi:hypothetical protein
MDVVALFLWPKKKPSACDQSHTDGPAISGDFSEPYFSITTGPTGVVGIEACAGAEVQQLANPATMNPRARVVISFFIRVFDY